MSETYQVRTFTQMQSLIDSGRVKSGDVVYVAGEKFIVK